MFISYGSILCFQVGQAFLAGTHEPATVKKKDLPKDLTYQ